MPSLYLTKSRARNPYVCINCRSQIPRGALYFRNDPAPYASWERRARSSHWCNACILSSVPEAAGAATRFVLPAVRVANPSIGTFIQPICVEVLPVARLLSQSLSADPTLVHNLSPEEFEDFVCEQLFAMGFEPKKVGRTNGADGGIDVVFWPREPTVFPILGAAQVKHRRDPARRVQPAIVREFAGTLAGRSFNAGLLVTNTSFTPNAEWFAREHAKLVRLRGFEDIRRWLVGNFTDEAEWREIPRSIEIAPGVRISIRQGPAG